MTLRAAATDRSARTEFRPYEPFRLQPIQGGIDRAGRDAALQPMLDFLENGPAVPFFPQLRLRTDERNQHGLFEDAEVFSQIACIVDKIPACVNRTKRR